MLENIRLSFRGIWSHKMRSFLTMLGIIIGIAAIIVIVSTIQGTNEQIKQNLVGSGTNTVSVALYHVDGLAFIHRRDYCDQMNYLKTDLSSNSLCGVSGDYFAVSGYQVTRGRGFR